MHWHPMIIKWCLHLKILSSALTMLFEHLGSSVCHQSKHYVITLTLRSAMGIQSDVNEQLTREANVTSLEER